LEQEAGIKAGAMTQGEVFVARAMSLLHAIEMLAARPAPDPGLLRALLQVALRLECELIVFENGLQGPAEARKWPD
jgi:hypothetical protein